MKTAVITGSAGGLGKEFAQRLLNSGKDTTQQKATTNTNSYHAKKSL